MYSAAETGAQREGSEGAFIIFSESQHATDASSINTAVGFIASISSLSSSAAGTVLNTTSANGNSALSAVISALSASIARAYARSAGFLAKELEKLGYKQLNKDYFDTLKIELPEQVSVDVLREIALECRVNLRYFETGHVGISVDETTQPTDIGVLLYIFAVCYDGKHRNLHYSEQISKKRKNFHYTENSVPRRKGSAASWRLQSRSSYFIRIQKLKRIVAFY